MSLSFIRIRIRLVEKPNNVMLRVLLLKMPYDKRELNSSYHETIVRNFKMRSYHSAYIYYIYGS
jgi:hypothetical protein